MLASARTHIYIHTDTPKHSRAHIYIHADLPLARIKRIMKADDDVHMIRAEAPVLFAKACEMFILELTLRCAHVCVYA